MLETQRKLLNPAGTDLMAMHREDKEMETTYYFFFRLLGFSMQHFRDPATIPLFVFYP